jgi:acetoin utilization deacetylase AcuC-like enzyme
LPKLVRSARISSFFYAHAACLDHGPGEGHPECPERLLAILDRIEGPEFLPLARREFAPAQREDLILAHDAGHVDAVLASIPRAGVGFIDGDTIVGAGSDRAALHAAGAVLDAVRAVLDTPRSNAFCAVRPPGHHAHRAKSGGFCLFNNVAIGAVSALRRYGLERVAVVDFDVHHGDGTQDILWDEPGALFVSMHQSPLYPGTGRPEETGAHDNILNIGLPPGSGDRDVKLAMRKTILPRLRAFAPQMIFVSAGFDAHRADPLGGLAVTEKGFASLMRDLLAAARTLCDGRLVAVLEGGYDTQSLAESVRACLREMMRKG